LLATSFTVPAKPLLPLPLLCVRWLLELRPCVLRFVPELDRFEPLLERAEPLRDDDAPLLDDEPLRRADEPPLRDEDALRVLRALAPDALVRDFGFELPPDRLLPFLLPDFLSSVATAHPSLDVTLRTRIPIQLGC
jgi:hypothetical protein